MATDREVQRQAEISRAQREADARAREDVRRRDLEQERAAEAARRRNEADSR